MVQGRRCFKFDMINNKGKNSTKKWQSLLMVGQENWYIIDTYIFFTHTHTHIYSHILVQCVPLATEPSISLIILTPMKILQRNLNRSTFVVWEMKRNESVVCVCSEPNCCDSHIITEMPGSLASETHCISYIHISIY